MKALAAFALVFTMAVPQVADAASGYVRGYWKLYQNQGNYCDPATRNCTGSQYLKSEYHTNVPIENTKLYVKDQNGVVIGQGTTSSSGYFIIQWNRVSAPTSVRVYWSLEHKDNRFRVRSSNGGTYSYWTSSITGTTNGSSIYTGTWYVGNSTTPSGIANIYNGAQRMWYDALNYSARMQNNFTDLQIRAYPTDCPTACAKTSSNRIHMPSGSEFRPQARILHEMGHIASYKSRPRQLTPGSYCYPGTGSGCGWSFTSEEWRGHSLEEGRATFFGDVAIYWHWAVDPRSCNSSGQCSASTFSLEPADSCSGKKGRHAINHDRYMWDIYDTVNDGETVSTPYYSFFDTLGAIPSGTSWGQTESFLNGSGSVDSWDSFHPWEWRNAMLNHYSGALETSSVYFLNCMNYF